MDLENHKEKFQVERIAFFSDAIFAIAITLLTIEIHAPKLTSGMSEAQVLHELKLIVPEFLGLLVSYIIIGGFWVRHHRIFNYIHHYSNKLIAINFIFLFTIILYPFSTSFLFNSYLERVMSKTQLVIYLLNPLLSSMALLGLVYIAGIKSSLSEKDRIVLNINRLWIMCLSFLLALISVLIWDKKYATYCFLFLLLPKFTDRLKKRFVDKINLASKPQSQN